MICALELVEVYPTKALLYSMKAAPTNSPIIKVSPPKKKDIITIRFMIVCAMISMLSFIVWFINPEHIGYGPIFWLLTAALVFKLVKMAHEWYHYWSPSIPVMPRN